MNNKRIASELNRVAKNIGAGTNDVFYDFLDGKGTIILFCELPKRETVSELASLIKKQEKSILAIGKSARLTPVVGGRNYALVNISESPLPMNYSIYTFSVGETIEDVELRIRSAGAIYKKMD